MSGGSCICSRRPLAGLNCPKQQKRDARGPKPHLPMPGGDARGGLAAAFVHVIPGLPAGRRLGDVEKCRDSRRPASPNRFAACLERPPVARRTLDPSLSCYSTPFLSPPSIASHALQAWRHIPAAESPAHPDEPREQPQPRRGGRRPPWPLPCGAGLDMALQCDAPLCPHEHARRPEGGRTGSGLAGKPCIRGSVHGGAGARPGAVENAPHVLLSHELQLSLQQRIFESITTPHSGQGSIRTQLGPNHPSPIVFRYCRSPAFTSLLGLVLELPLYSGSLPRSIFIHVFKYATG